MEKAINSHSINKANPTSKMFPTPPTTSLCGDYIFHNKIIPLTKKTNNGTTEVELLVCFVTGKKKNTLLIFCVCCMLVTFKKLNTAKIYTM